MDEPVDGTEFAMHRDYQRIASAISYLQDHSHAQPHLAEVAQQVHLSEYHFQRLFSRWAGVSPKRYLQFLTLERAKDLLRESSTSTLAASAELGLGSSSRLYDHFVQLEGVTPSEFRSRGQGLHIRYTNLPTPYGEVFVARTERGICQLNFLDAEDKAAPLARLRDTWPEATLDESADAADPSLVARLHGEPPPATPLSLWVCGTNFQLSVWRALLQLQPGDVSSYSRIAAAVGKPAAVRAVGSAIGANPVALVIPCHRVLRQSGELGGYRWGITRKQAILARESARQLTTAR